eukprot:9613115-Prorocentrum_lima.AAC.1
MTSSLVGSEMCIRDSFGGWFQQRARNKPTANTELIRIVHVSALRELSPVSYTHLTLPTICSV